LIKGKIQTGKGLEMTGITDILVAAEEAEAVGKSLRKASRIISWIYVEIMREKDRISVVI
jgi:hypothetical protein